MYCASTQARTALTYGKEYLQDGTWELEDDEEEAWESGGNGWDVSPTLLVPELPLLAYKGIMCVAFLPFPTSSSDCTPDPRTELTVRSASKMGDEEEEAAESGGNGWDAAFSRGSVISAFQEGRHNVSDCPRRIELVR
ncbi:uncharacterized protein LOC135818337 [Sycon ciliatum]|uniref:uncharacterized protein LOC135818337 n=1 Tax=Sycon ciliatum TaxID=27933 RepID=UPI0031F64D05